MALKAGTDLDCGRTYDSLVPAVRQGLVSEALVDTAVIRLFTARFRLGMFDPPSEVRWAQIPFSDNDSPAHRALALDVAHESMVLLKNAGGLLPLRKDEGLMHFIRDAVDRGCHDRQHDRLPGDSRPRCPAKCAVAEEGRCGNSQ